MASHGSSKKLLFPPSVQIAKIIVPLKMDREFIIALQNANMLDIIPVDTTYSVEEVDVTSGKDKINQLSEKISTLFDAVGLKPSDCPPSTSLMEIKKGSFDEIITSLEEKVDTDYPIITDLVKRKDELEKELDNLEELNDFAIKLKKLNIDPKLLLKGGRTFTLFGYVNEDSFERLSWELRELTDNSILIIHEDADDVRFTILLNALNRYEEAITNSLRQFNVEIITNKESLYEMDIDTLPSQILTLETELNDIQNDLDAYKTESSDILLAYDEILEIESQRAELLSQMKRTKSTLLCWGWIKTIDTDVFTKQMKSQLDDAIEIEITTPNFSEEHYPTASSNPKFLQPYRDLVSAFGTPGYHEIDPMNFMVFLFPVLFGLMFADVGHGFILTLVGIFALLKKRKGEVTNEFAAYITGGAELLIMCGISAFFFGFIFGSFFGDETILRTIPWLSWLDVFWDHMFDSHGKRNVMTVLIISFAVGIVIITFGLGLNIYQKLRYMHSWTEPAGPFFLGVFYWGTILTLATGHKLALAAMVIGLIGLSVAEIKHAGGEGAMMIFDHVLSIFSHTLSFGRILALNMVHAILSGLPYIMYDRFGGTSMVVHDPAEWSLYIGPFIFCAVIGALIVIPVEGLISFLHTLRLNWVEWYSRFYEGRGYAFKPVTVNRRHTIEITTPKALSS